MGGENGKLIAEIDITSMRKTFVSLAVGLSVIVLIGAGCASSAPGSGTGDGGSAIPAARSGCDHPYYPLRSGYEIEYKTQVPGMEESSYTVRVVDESGDTIRMEYDFMEGVSVQQQIRCAGGVVEALGYVDFGAATSGNEIQTETRSTSGVLLPQNMRAGTSWESTYEISATFSGPDFAGIGVGSIDSTVTVNRTVIGEETVTVPAGTYQALKVEGVTTIAAVIAGIPGGIPPTEISTTEYWVRGVGMVKSVSGSGETESTTEAARVVTP